MPNKLLIYSPKITNRLRYTFELVFKNLIGIPYEITTNKEVFLAYQDAKLNYSSRQFEEEPFFYASPLLFERGIKKQRIKIEDFEDTQIFFLSKNNTHLPFDIFAASFYLVSRYEEYLATEKDRFGRFPAEVSLAYKYGFLRKPIVNIWMNKLKKVLQKCYPNLEIHQQHYHFIPTYDVDIAYAYKYKGILRSIGAYAIALKNFRFEEIAYRTKVLLGLEKDPFDTYNWQLKIRKRYKLQPIYFFLVGDYGRFDKNISIDHLRYQDLIQSAGDYCDVGIHPSFQSNQHIRVLSKEINRLSKVLKKDISRSRQHYIKLHIPHTYEKLIELDIRKDYSMGYPSQIGFRAGVASSFYFYDLNLEVKTNLKVFPFAVMDVTLKNYLKMKPQKALDTIKKMIAEVRAVNGLFITLWHNHTLSDEQDWMGWRTVYEETVKAALIKVRT